jgi:hypothetical protein
MNRNHRRHIQCTQYAVGRSQAGEMLLDKQPIFSSKKLKKNDRRGVYRLKRPEKEYPHQS